MTRRRRDIKQKTAARNIGMAAVFMVGHLEKHPRHFGDNEGGQAVRIGMTTSDIENAAKADDSKQPTHRMDVLHYVYVQSDAHARRLRDKMDEMLLGRGVEAARFGYRYIDDPDTTWHELLQQALHELGYASYSDADRIQKIKDEIERWTRLERRR